MAHLAAQLVHSASSVELDGGFLPRIRAWFAALAPRAADDVPPQGSPSSVMPRVAAPMIGEATRINDRARGMQAESDKRKGTIIAFPRSGQVELVQLAEDLRRRFYSLGLDDHDPVQLRVDGGAQPCLWIDNTAYVEARSSGAYRLVLNDAFETRITMETSDVESIGDFVRHYIIARYAAAQARGGRG
jgi:hypothetical protein